MLSYRDLHLFTNAPTLSSSSGPPSPDVIGVSLASPRHCPSADQNKSICKSNSQPLLLSFSSAFSPYFLSFDHSSKFDFSSFFLSFFCCVFSFFRFDVSELLLASYQTLPIANQLNHDDNVGGGVVDKDDEGSQELVASSRHGS